MSDSHLKDFTYVIWQDPFTRRRYNVGRLSRNGKYEFQYDSEIDEARASGFMGILPFEEKRVYTSESLFPVFAGRLPDRKRRDINKILEKYGMDDYDDFELLRRSGARVPIDTLEFARPISLDEPQIYSEFFIAGTRHCLGCSGDNCNLATLVEIDERLKLLPESLNEYDPNAVRLVKQSGEVVGYVPRYHSASIKKLIESNPIYNCMVLYQTSKNCSECIRVSFEINNTLNDYD